MTLETTYLKKALSKAGFVIIVKTCYRAENKTKLEYISENATELGMNPEMLQSGLKLTEDYIHPEDRMKVITAAKQARDDKLFEYYHEYRLVGDGGNITKVHCDMVITDLSENTYRMEIYMRPVAKSYNNEQKKKAPKTEKDKKKDKSLKFKDSNSIEKMQLMMETVSKMSNLYSVLVSTEGKVRIPPVGPSTNMGDFYDLFEKPEYKAYFKTILQKVEENEGPTIVCREEGGNGRISAAPIMIKDKLYGIWILGSYTPEETERLKNLCESHWQFRVPYQLLQSRG